MKLITILAFLLVLLDSVNANALILRTDDGGESWFRETTVCTLPLNGVSIDPMSGLVVAVGDRGTILRREAEGRWEDVSLPEVSSDLRSVAVGFDGLCMACGDSGTLISSFDRGNSWRVWNEFGYQDIDLLSVNFDPSASSSFVITGERGFVYTSTDRVAETGTVSSFIGSCVQLCSSFPEIAVSSSGEIYSPREDSLHEQRANLSFNGVTQVVSGSGAFAAVGDEGLVCTYSNGEWRVRESGCTEDLYSIAHITYGRNVCAVGENGTILHSKDGGETWSPLYSGLSRNLNGITGNGSGTGYIVGDSFWGRVFPWI